MKKLVLFLSCFSLFVASQAAVSIPLELKTAVTDVSGLVAVGVGALIIFLALFFGAKAGIGLVHYAGRQIRNFMRGTDNFSSGGFVLDEWGNKIKTFDNHEDAWADYSNRIDNFSTDLQLKFGNDFASDYRDARYEPGVTSKQAWKRASHNARQAARDSRTFSGSPSAYREITF